MTPACRPGPPRSRRRKVEPGRARARLPVHQGNEQASLGDIFHLKGKGNGEIRIEGDLSRIKLIGAGMSAGRVVIEGSAGMHLGVNMSGGEILVNGDAGDWVGPETSGGRIVIKGDAGHMVGSAYRGSQAGVTGGEIIVHGNAGNETGNTMRNGLIAIGGDCGDFAGVNMRAGTIVVLGRLGHRPGAGMKRGSIVSMEDARLLTTFTYACHLRLRPPADFLAPLSVAPSRARPRHRRRPDRRQFPALERRFGRAQPRRGPAARPLSRPVGAAVIGPARWR